ncbi:hypothetical protein [Porphyromonas circumdentaria]|uniref:Pregnancy-associated plasma protein-A n=1 Tax=Porphyromonas circumdentaria TaxID=29524 RepID=A0A1T4MEI2_9PORP|nr:hypothetical protein [Porphyromonas circumdentaria]MBB6275790.1 hypothetical protein [Porphyromonas circumdentaria]SJZ65295.1 hypothetical protein SAMN02745171_00738 [Porphyromonas circumdentaria]
MKYLKYIFFLLFLFQGISLSLQAQEDGCGTRTGRIPRIRESELAQWERIVLANEHQEQVIRVNVHFVLHPNDIIFLDTLRNFHPSMPEGSGLENGYQYAERLVKSTNEILESNSKMFLIPGNTVEVRPAKIKIQLSGVFFDVGFPSQGPGLKSTHDIHKKNPDDCFEVYIYGKGGHNIRYSGIASLPGTYLILYNNWCSYLNDYNKLQNNPQEPVYSYAIQVRTLAHELGHCLSLYHSMVRGRNDDCSDTPTSKEAKDYALEIIKVKDRDPGHYWVKTRYAETDTIIPDGDRWKTKSNNLMDYGSGIPAAITPQQIAKMHIRLTNPEMHFYKKGNIRKETEIVRNFSNNKSVIARKVVIAPNETLTIPPEKALFVSCKELEIKKGFVVGKGGVFQVNIEK